MEWIIFYGLFSTKHVISFGCSRLPDDYTEDKFIFCLDDTVRHTDLMQSREQIKKVMSQGEKIMQMIEEQKGAFSAGKAFSSGLSRIIKTVFDRVNWNAQDMRWIAQKKEIAAQMAMKKK